MSTLLASYLGITGFTALDQLAFLGVKRPTGSPRRVMAGVLASAKTVAGQATTNRRYPHRAQLSGLLTALRDAGAWPVVHFNAPTGDAADAITRLLDALEPTQDGTIGIQLNLVGVTPDVIRALQRKRLYGTYRVGSPLVSEVILQVNAASLRERSVAAVGDYVARYEGVAHHALLDFSGGMGKGFDPIFVRDVLLAHGDAWLAMGIRPGVAGGLGAGGSASLRPLVSLGDLLEAAGRPDLLAACSIDAETGVRRAVVDPIPGERHQDVLDHGLAATYLTEADRFFADRDEPSIQSHTV